MKQIIEIEVPNGKKAVWKDGKIIFEDIKPQLPKTWEEFCEQNKIKKAEYYLNVSSCIEETGIGKRNKIFDKNLLPNRKAAEQHLALMQLHQLRDVWRERWLPDWNDDKQEKYVIESSKGECYVAKYKHISSFLSFQDEKRANDFLDYFRDLIMKAGDLI